MKRDKHWGQENPRDQARVILGAIEGDLINIQSGILSNRKIATASERAIALMQDVKKLIASFEEGNWD